MHINFIIFPAAQTRRKTNLKIYLSSIENALFKINWKFSCETFKSQILKEKEGTIQDFPHLLKPKSHNIYIKPNIFPRIFYDFLLAKSERERIDDGQKEKITKTSLRILVEIEITI
jgi:hypothetical protein